MKLKIFGANLRDQSKGQFVVHAADCSDCAKLKGEACVTEEHSTLTSISDSINFDLIKEGSVKSGDFSEIHFAPCVNLPVS